MSLDFAGRAYRRLRRDFNRSRFMSAAAGVLACPPLARGQEPFTALSMVHTRDVLPYLVALRSFALQANPERVVVVCDPTITDEDRSTLTQAVPHIELRRAEEFRSGHTPVGGCWERLYAITGYTPKGPVVQLDADTVTRGSIAEVVQAVRADLGFVLGEEPAQQLVTLQAAHERAARWQSPTMHVQALSEFVMSTAGLKDQMYVRGCAGFTGFRRDDSLRERLLAFSSAMAALTGGRWSEWGTEQVASNYLVANQAGTRVLPFPDYGTPDQYQHSPRFVHFIGSMRFESGRYREAAREVIGTLRAGGRHA